MMMTSFVQITLKSLAASVVLFTGGGAYAGPQADAVVRVVTQHAVPAVLNFSAQTKALEVAAKSDCTAGALVPAYNAGFDAWMGLQHLNIGPVEADARGLTIAFWPDKKGMIPKTLSSLIVGQDAAVADADEFAHVSIAARGLFALEYMLFDDEFNAYEQGSYSCELVQAITHDLAQTADHIAGEWTREDGFAATLTTAGAQGNQRYLSETEAAQALYTMLLTGLENSAEQRIGRPLGSFEKPRPKRAEAYRSGRSARNVMLSVQAAREFVVAMAPETPTHTLEVLDDVLAKLQDLDDPTFASVEDPMGRLKIEIIAQRIEAATDSIANDIGVPLGISAGFNASDGD
ncbi:MULTISPECIES: imelysin family protein [Pacificibacter]|uniref:imelysin family protein n=1 Tax=Pacificibacter TaxID=1042323 RepID=UPI001C086424|nr:MULTISPECIES: imelysin family protein [Pacificibacter]MBU2935478.1 imelysin family protein [Pacificibacter marinus]MDO6613975.1 imelysin family protein [Pacificibacter sp. 1_MG-2023]